MSLKKGFLYLLIGSVCTSALLGIFAFLLGSFGSLEIKVLLTTLTISAASVCGLSCAGVLEARRKAVAPMAGLALTVVAVHVVIGGIWLEPHSETFWRTAATLAVLAGAASHVSLFLLARLRAIFQWSIWVALAIVLSIAFLITLLIWGDPEEWVFRALGVAAILDVTFTILIPVFHRLSRGDLASADGPSLADIENEIAALERRIVELRRLKQTL